MASIEPISAASTESSSTCIGHQPTLENERTDLEDLDDDVGFEVKRRISGLNLQCQGRGREIPRLIHEDVPSADEFMFLKRGTEGIHQLAHNPNLEIEDSRFKKCGIEKEIEENQGLEKKDTDGLKLWKEKGDGAFMNFALGIIKEPKKCKEVDALNDLSHQVDVMELAINPACLRGDPLSLALAFNEEFAAMSPKLKIMADEIDRGDADVESEIKEMDVNVELFKERVTNDGQKGDVGENRVHQLLEEIKQLDLMLERGTDGFLDLELMMKELEGLKESEEGLEAAKEVEVRIGELHDGLQELKAALLELKNDKSKELSDFLAKQEEKKQEFHADAEEGLKGRKLNWGKIVAAIGLVTVAAVTAVFMEPTKEKAKVHKGNKHRSR